MNGRCALWHVTRDGSPLRCEGWAPLLAGLFMLTPPAAIFSCRASVRRCLGPWS